MCSFENIKFDWPPFEGLFTIHEQWEEFVDGVNGSGQ